MGIEPTRSAWKAEVLPLNYTRVPTKFSNWTGLKHSPNTQKNWRGKDSNLRRLSRQIYSLLPLTARVPLQNELGSLREAAVNVNSFIACSFNNIQESLTISVTSLKFE